MCLDDSHEFATQELFKAVRLFMARNGIAAAVLHDREIFIVIGEKDEFEKQTGIEVK
jgi:hypothetical protein